MTAVVARSSNRNGAEVDADSSMRIRAGVSTVNLVQDAGAARMNKDTLSPVPPTPPPGHPAPHVAKGHNGSWVCDRVGGRRQREADEGSQGQPLHSLLWR